jgi:hypothetical protein
VCFRSLGRDGMEDSVRWPNSDGKSPPLCKTYRNKSGEGLSFRMLLMLGIGVALWLVYGIMGKSLPLKRETAWRHSQI